LMHQEGERVCRHCHRRCRCYIPLGMPRVFYEAQRSRSPCRRAQRCYATSVNVPCCASAMEKMPSVDSERTNMPSGCGCRASLLRSSLPATTSLPLHSQPSTPSAAQQQQPCALSRSRCAMRLGLLCLHSLHAIAKVNPGQTTQRGQNHPKSDY